MIPSNVPICMMCEHLRSGFESDSGAPFCAAFPNGIPKEIWEDGYDHRQPLRNESILFKLKEGQEDALADWEAEMAANEEADILGPLLRNQDV